MYRAQAEDAITIYRAAAAAFGGSTDARDEWLETMKEIAGWEG